MLLIDPDGLFNGDRLRRCSNIAQLHFVRLFLASDGFARIEFNYARIIGRAYPTFNPVPSETEIQSFLQEYAQNSLLFVYQMDGQFWGQWDVPRSNILPRHKTAQDRRSPAPPEPAFTAWKRRYREQREQNKAFPKFFGKIPEEFPRAVAVAVALNPIAHLETDEPAPVSPTPTAAPRGSGHGLPNQQPTPSPYITNEVQGLKAVNVACQVNGPSTPNNPTPGQWRTYIPKTPDSIEQHFAEFWTLYPRKVCRKAALDAYRKAIKAGAAASEILEGLRRQLPELLQRDPQYQPHAKTWLNQMRWVDEPTPPAQPSQIPVERRYL